MGRFLKRLRELDIYDDALIIQASPTPPSYAAISETLRVIGDERGARFWRCADCGVIRKTKPCGG